MVRINMTVLISLEETSGIKLHTNVISRTKLKLHNVLNIFVTQYKEFSYKEKIEKFKAHSVMLL